MKLSANSKAADASIMARVLNIVAKFGFKRKQGPSARERYEAAIDSGTITPDMRRAALINAAADPGIKAALDEADAAYEQHVKGLGSGELQGRAFTPSPPQS